MLQTQPATFLPNSNISSFFLTPFATQFSSFSRLSPFIPFFHYLIPSKPNHLLLLLSQQTNKQIPFALNTVLPSSLVLWCTHFNFLSLFFSLSVSQLFHTAKSRKDCSFSLIALWYTTTAPINPESLMQSPPEMKTHTLSSPWIAQALPTTTREPGQSSCLSSYSSPSSLAATSSHPFSFPPPSRSLSCVSNHLASSLRFFFSLLLALCVDLLLFFSDSPAVENDGNSDGVPVNDSTCSSVSAGE